ncbi:ATP-binding protein [Streptomyces angustmyceticus]|uniref:ATP-binding protein n=1 Tax=Streptomyces angustmyceticus TaxID=285578 RepID=UPI0021AEFFAA|nr:ATP-binding protein [Streptomyces angustmyceticus]
MYQAAANTEAHRPWTEPTLTSYAAFDASTASIAAARAFARDFLTQVQSEHGLPVSSQVLGTGQLVVSELVTNACKYAPGPCLVELEIVGATLVITVWDSDPTLPDARPADPERIGRHGLEIVLAVCEDFDVQREPVGKRIKVRIPLA